MKIHKSVALVTMMAVNFSPIGFVFAESTMVESDYLQRREEIKINVSQSQVKLKENRTLPVGEKKDVAALKKKLLGQELQRLDNRIELSRHRVLKTEYTDKKEAQKVLDVLKKREKWVSDIQDSLAKVEAGAPGKPLQQLLDQVNKQWNEEGESAKFKRTIAQTKILRTNELILASEKLIASLELEVKRLQDKSIPVESLKGNIAEAKTHLKASRTNKEAASKEIIKVNANAQPLRAAIEESNRLIRESNSSLRKMQAFMTKAAQDAKAVKTK